MSRLRADTHLDWLPNAQSKGLYTVPLAVSSYDWYLGVGKPCRLDVTYIEPSEIKSSRDSTISMGKAPW